MAGQQKQRRLLAPQRKDRRKPSVAHWGSANLQAEQDRPQVLVPSLCQAPAIGGISHALGPGCRELVMFPDEGDQAERQFWIGLEFRVSSEMETQQIKGRVRELTRRTRGPTSRTTNGSGFGAMDSFPNVTS